MRARMRRLLSCAGLLAVIFIAVDARAQVLPCDASPKVTVALRNLPKPTDDPQADAAARLAALRGLLKRFPNDVYLHQRYQDSPAFRRTAEGRDALIAEYRALAEKHPKDPLYRFLAARAQVGSNTRQVLPELEALAPTVPRARLKLVEIYQSRVFKDAKKVREHLEAFFTACPTSISGFSALNSVEPSDFVTRNVGRLRTILQGRRDPESIVAWTMLWPLEFKVKPATEHDALRRQVADDLKRLRTLEPGGDPAAYYDTLQEGYKLTGDTDGGKWAAAQLTKVSPQSNRYEARSQWYKDHPYPKPTDSEDARKAYFAALAKASADWVRESPNDSSAWYTRVEALQNFDGATPADVETAGEMLIKTQAKNPGQFYFVSEYGGNSCELVAAYLYASKGVRTDRLAELVKQGLPQLSAPPPWGPPSDLSPRPTNDNPNREFSEWYGNLTVADIWLKVRDKDRAREALARTQTILLNSKPKADAKDAAQASKQQAQYKSRLGQYWQRMGDLAQLEGRKADAMSYYQNALLARTETPAAGAKDELGEKARSLWKDIGGTNEGWIAWSDRKELFAQPSEAAARRTWDAIEKRLPDFQLTDLTGKKWDLAALKGKITLINVWAST